MISIRRAAALFVLALSLGACSGTIPIAYTPQTFAKVGTGSVEMGNFAYSAGVEANQLQNTAAGSIYTSGDIAQFVRRATALELEKSGLTVQDGSAYVVTGDVKEFKLDDLGYSVDWTYRVAYRLAAADGSAIVDKTYSVGPVRTGKFGQPGDYTPSVNQMVTSGIEQFMEDLKASGVFSGPATS